MDCSYFLSALLGMFHNASELRTIFLDTNVILALRSYCKPTHKPQKMQTYAALGFMLLIKISCFLP